jgi:AraC-like DNA-binding protein
MNYRWRMTLAAERLASPAITVSALVRLVGYESEKSFGIAFRRIRGISPGAYARGRIGGDYSQP